MSDKENLNLENNVGRLEPVDVEDELKKSFISYAMAVIVTRALPDVRDGLKPVDRKSTRLNSSHPTTSRMPSSA